MTRFDVERGNLDYYDVQRIGGETILMYWIPADEQEEFNQHIVGWIDVVRDVR